MVLVAKWLRGGDGFFFNTYVDCFASYMIGYYLYAESSGRAGKRAQLVSPWQPAQADGKCLKLYYNMYGKTMGSLSIKLELSNGNNWLIFYETGNQGSNWKKGMGNIDVSLGLYYRVRITKYRFYHSGAVETHRPHQTRII